MSNAIGCLVSSKGYFLVFQPFINSHGNIDIILDESKFGTMRWQQKHGRFYHWTVYFGKHRIELFSPGELIQEEILDPADKVVTRKFQFRDELYTYHSGIRYTYYSKHPKEKTKTFIWIPDEIHKDNKCAVSFGLTNNNGFLVDPIKAMQFMFDFKKDFGPVVKE